MNLKLLFLSLISFCHLNSYSQTDRNGAPVFNSEIISEESLEKYGLTSGYYTIGGNISNEESSVYVKDDPSLEDYINFSLSLPSYFFILHKNDEIKYMISLLPKRDLNNTINKFLIINPANRKTVEVASKVSGDISEKRAEELIKMKVDTSAAISYTIEGRFLSLGGKEYKIQSYDKVKEELLEIAGVLIQSGKNKKEKIANPAEYIRKESIGGKLDFEKTLEGNKLYIHNSIAYNKYQYSLVLWGGAVKKLNIKSSDDAIELWEEIYKKELTETDREALVNGFESE